jgi:hypothetical protein
MPNRYHLYVKVQGRWEWVRTIEAENHTEAFRRAMHNLEPEHYDKPIRLEQEETRAGKKG